MKSHKPHLIRNMSAQILNRSHAAVLLFDAQDKLYFLNENANVLFPKMETGSTKSFFRENYLIDDFDALSGRMIYLNLDVHNLEETCYLFEHEKVINEQNEVEGSYFMLTDMTSEEKQKREAFVRVGRDILTGLLNEAGFFEKIERIFMRNPATDYKIIVSNITSFKLVNELLGREKGDEILSTIGSFITPFVGHDVAASRLEGDHFALCIPRDFDLKALSGKVNRYLKEASPALSIQCYFGVYEIEDAAVAIELMVENANLALEAIREDSGEHIVHFNEELGQDILLKNELLADLEPALANKEFELYFQPQVDSFSEKVVGAEVLIRWNHSTRGFLTPYHFVDLLEKKGRLYELDLFVWEEACKVLRQLNDKGYPISFSVNISPKDIFKDDLTKVFCGLIEKYNLEPRMLKLEITETAVILDSNLLQKLVRDFHKAGFIVEMDDFGSGYSSLNSLKDIPVDIIKTDRVFFKETENMERSKIIFESVLRLARSLNTPIIAEGIETKEQLEYLRSIGCHNIQGFYYSPPIPLDAFVAFMDEHGIEQIKV